MFKVLLQNPNLTSLIVCVKLAAQQDIQSIHRIRERLVQNRTALSNEIRGLLTKYDITFKTGIRVILVELPHIIRDK